MVHPPDTLHMDASSFPLFIQRKVPDHTLEGIKEFDAFSKGLQRTMHVGLAHL